MLRSFASFDRSRPVAGLAFVASLAMAQGAAATTWRVQPDSVGHGSEYYATVLEANAVAVAGDSIEVSNAAPLGTYHQSATLALVDGVVYRGGFGPHFEGPNPVLYETTLKCEPPADSTDVPAVDATGFSSVFAGFTVTGGHAEFNGGGIYCGSGCSGTIRNCRVEGNQSLNVGGGIAVAQSASPYIFNCDIRRNSATLRGGGISVAQVSSGTRIEFCRIVACSSAVGGQSSGGGGGIFTASPIQVTRCEIDSCYTGYRGGGLLTRNVSPYCAANQFKHCFAQQSGGAAFHETGDGRHLNSSFEDCHASAGNGGGLFFQAGTWLVQGCFIRNCTASGRGGGVYYEAPTGAVLRLTEVVGNTSTRGGGVGIVGSLFRTPLSVSVESCTIALNTANVADPGAGGGIHVFPEGNYADAIVNCIVAQQVKGSCIATEGALNQPNIRFDCVWNGAANPSPAYGLSCADRTGINGNIQADPLFCDTAARPPQLTLQAAGAGHLQSPCMDAGEGGIDMGAHPDATPCALVAVEEASWGRIKARFR
ncbi:MAG: right-handed parallel beta-helix repeat-containing protein [bacterium]